MLGIAIVHYYAEALLQACVRSLQRSSYTDFRICVVDNGSRHGLSAVAALDERIEIVTAPRNLGFASGTNLAVSRFGPAVDRILLMNPDVTVEPGTLATLLAALDADPAIGAMACALYRPSGALDPACRRSDPTLFSALMKFLRLPRLLPGSPSIGAYNLTWLPADEAHDIGSGTAAFLLLRREVLERVRGFDPRFFLYGEDLDLCRRARQAGYRIRYEPAARAVHVKGSGRIREPATTRHFYHAIWIYYRKWGWFRTNPIVLSALAAVLVLLGAGEVAVNDLRRRALGAGRVVPRERCRKIPARDPLA